MYEVSGLGRRVASGCGVACKRYLAVKGFYTVHRHIDVSREHAAHASGHQAEQDRGIFTIGSLSGINSYTSADGARSPPNHVLLCSSLNGQYQVAHLKFACAS